ncbi:MAG: hypothetical protein ABI361_09735 [Nitrososphaera sp.]|jgi:plastocyanin
MSAAGKKGGDEDAGGYSKYMKGVAGGLLVMGISITAIIALYLSFGHLGSSFSTTVLQKQQDTLRKQYGLPAQPVLTPKEAEIPPSLRGFSNETQIASNSTTNLANTTATGNATGSATSNQTAGQRAAASTSASGPSNNSTRARNVIVAIRIPAGAGAQQVKEYYQPNPASVQAGVPMVWDNRDTAPHTATADNGSFDTGIIAAGQSGSAKMPSTPQPSLAYHCTIHPFMHGTLNVVG